MHGSEINFTVATFILILGSLDDSRSSTIQVCLFAPAEIHQGIASEGGKGIKWKGGQRAQEMEWAHTNVHGVKGLGIDMDGSSKYQRQVKRGTWRLAE